MKSSIKRKKWSMGIGGLMICLCLSGCGKTENENIAGIIQIETMEEEMSGKQTVGETENDENAEDEQNNKLERLEGSIESIEEKSQEQPQKQPQEQPQGEQVELLHGKITTTESGSFTIFRADVNGDVMVSTEESVKIVYTADTEIEVCRSSDRGITSTTSKGTAADIISGRQVRISGVYEGADFLAEKITVSIFRDRKSVV